MVGPSGSSGGGNYRAGGKQMDGPSSPQAVPGLRCRFNDGGAAGKEGEPSRNRLREQRHLSQDTCN